MSAAETPEVYETPVQIVDAWTGQGPIVRFQTGIIPLTKLCVGGFQNRRRVYIIGPPGSCKTGLLVRMADKLLEQGVCVGYMAADEEGEDVTLRFLQMRGFKIEDIESRDPAVLAKAREAIEGLKIRFYPGDVTIEDAAADLAGWARVGRRRQ
jgi:predicted ATP-dependent serine protease